jgi:hypothetical protein
MSEPAGKAELMRSLGRLVRGLSALFWGLPVALVIFGLIWVQTVTGNIRPNPLTEWLISLNIFPPVAVTSFLFYGLLQLSHFQKQERVWQHALDRAKITGLVNIGFSPFLHWWNQMPFVPFYALAVAILMLSGLLFLVYLNLLLKRLAAMLPDETLRVETSLFTSLNQYLLSGIFILFLLYFILLQIPTLPVLAVQILQGLEIVRQWLMLFLVLLPVAMTMTLIWKMKEVIFSSVFGEQS